MKDKKPLILSLALSLGVGALSALLIRRSVELYKNVVQPPLAPPAWVFPVVWGILFLLMGISAARVYLRGGGEAQDALFVYATQLGGRPPGGGAHLVRGPAAGQFLLAADLLQRPGLRLRAGVDHRAVGPRVHHLAAVRPHRQDRGPADASLCPVGDLRGVPERGRVVSERVRGKTRDALRMEILLSRFSLA